jgi:hypothetical protein
MAATQKKTSVISLAKELGVTRAKTALKFFHEEHRETYEAENPEQSAREVRSALADQWESLETDARQKFLAQEQEDRTRFMTQLREEMEKAGMDLSLLPSPKTKKAKAPKRVTLAKALGVAPCKSAFHYFGMKVRKDLEKEGSDHTAQEVMVIISERWSSLTDKKKAPFQKKADKDKTRYEKEMEAAKESNPEIVEETAKANALIRKERRKNKKNDPNRVKRGLTAYMIFCNEKRQEVKTSNPDMSAKDVLKTLAQMWKTASDEEKVPYQEKAAEDKERYLREKAEKESADEKSGDEEEDA